MENNRKTLKIAFAGRQRSGKSYMGKMLSNVLNETDNIVIKYLSLADPVYDISDMFYVCMGKPFEKNRKLLQMIGTDIGRNLLDENIWINYLLGRVQQEEVTEYKNQIIVVSDVRFKNELKGLREKGFHVYWVYGKWGKRKRFWHKSERDLLWCILLDMIRKRLRLSLKYFDGIIYNPKHDPIVYNDLSEIITYAVEKQCV